MVWCGVQQGTTNELTVKTVIVTYSKIIYMFATIFGITIFKTPVQLLAVKGCINFEGHPVFTIMH